MKIYNDTPLANGNAITVITFFKPTYSIITGTKLQNVEVSSIANIDSGTVTARIGSNDSFAELDKIELVAYINWGGYSLTE